LQLTGVCASDPDDLKQTEEAADGGMKACRYAFLALQNFKDDPLVREKVGYFVSREGLADNSTMEEVHSETNLAFQAQASF